MKIAIVTGPRNISAQDEQLVRDVVRELIRRGFKIYVGDATGVDSIAWEESFSAYYFAFQRGMQGRPPEPKRFEPLESLGRTPAGLAERSTRMVKEALRNSGTYADYHGYEIICVGFPNKSCPMGIVPARTWRSGEPEGSGTWSTIALAIGHNIETWIMPIDECPLLDALEFPAFLEVTGWNIPVQQQNFGNAFAWRYLSTPTLFSHDELANGYTAFVRDENNPL